MENKHKEELYLHKMNLLRKYNHDHPVLSQIGILPDKQFEELLLQQRFLSFQFTPLYDEAECFLNSKEARKVVRELRLEEYPARKPSHRQDLFTDLASMGLSKERIALIAPTEQTRQVIEDLYAIVRPRIKESAEEYDARCLAGLEMAEEKLVAETYEVILPRLTRGYGLKESVFFQPHAAHDDAHAKKLSKTVETLIQNDSTLQAAKEGLEKGFQARWNFYLQFYST
ncbi:MAG: iron-containing redox enzyme family protein [Nanoarchaeota archaeon]